MPELRPTTDGIVTIRPPRPGDGERLVAGRDDEFHRWLGAGDPNPCPVGCIVVGGEVVGWVDHDADRSWLLPGEVNIGYHVFAAHRGLGHASRAVQLLMHHLAVADVCTVGTLLIDAQNHRSQRVAARTRFDRQPDLDGHPYFKRSVPPLAYSDGTVTIRRRDVTDLDADLEATDDAHIDWLWSPGQRETWEAMSVDARRDHARAVVVEQHALFETGPKFAFSVETPDARCVAYVDADLANRHVHPGEVNIAYAAHPEHRGRGYVGRAVRLVLAFARDHTAARRAHIVVDERNVASLRVTASVGAVATERFVDPDDGRPMIRHVLAI